MYAELFEWLRTNINDELARGGGGGGAPAPPPGGGEELTIGLLDIFGFESFSVFDSKAKVWRTQNSLEQLCINFANEALQMLFNRKAPPLSPPPEGGGGAPGLRAADKPPGLPQHPAAVCPQRDPGRGQVLESDKLLYSAEFDPADVPDVPLNHRGAQALAYIELVTAKLGDCCREAERREDHDKMGIELVDNIRQHRRQVRERAPPLAPSASRQACRGVVASPGAGV